MSRIERIAGVFCAVGLAACADSLALATATPNDGGVIGDGDAGTLPNADGGPLTEAGTDGGTTVGDHDAGLVVDAGPRSTCAGTFAQTWGPTTPPPGWTLTRLGSSSPTVAAGELRFAWTQVDNTNSQYLSHDLPTCGWTMTLSIEFNTSTLSNAFDVLVLRDPDDLSADVKFALDLAGGTILFVTQNSNGSSVPYDTGTPLRLDYNATQATVTVGTDAIQGTVSIPTGNIKQMLIGNVERDPNVGLPSGTSNVGFGPISVTAK